MTSPPCDQCKIHCLAAPLKGFPLSSVNCNLGEDDMAIVEALNEGVFTQSELETLRYRALHREPEYSRVYRIRIVQVSEV